MTADAFMSVGACFYPCFACTNTCLGGQEIILSRVRSKKADGSWLICQCIASVGLRAALLYIVCRLILADLLIYLKLLRVVSLVAHTLKSHQHLFPKVTYIVDSLIDGWLGQGPKRSSFTLGAKFRCYFGVGCVRVMPLGLLCQGSPVMIGRKGKV